MAEVLSLNEQRKKQKLRNEPILTGTAGFFQNHLKPGKKSV
jgi:hypothetical protein